MAKLGEHAGISDGDRCLRGEDLQQLLEILAAQAAVAIRNASMFTELRHQIGDG